MCKEGGGGRQTREGNVIAGGAKLEHMCMCRHVTTKPTTLFINMRQVKIATVDTENTVMKWLLRWRNIEKIVRAPGMEAGEDSETYLRWELMSNWGTAT